MPAESPGSHSRIFHLAISAAGLVGLILQYHATVDLLAARGIGTGAALMKLASFFTILTNLLLTVVHSVCLFAPRSRAGRAFARPAVQTSLLLYIAIVGLVYSILLAKLWNPQGAQWWADHLLHHVTPLLQLAFWIVCVPKKRLSWTYAASWLGYPTLYLIWILARGSQVADYPYPFVNLDKLGLARTLGNSAAMAAAFLCGGLLLIGVSRWLAKPAMEASAGKDV